MAKATLQRINAFYAQGLIFRCIFFRPEKEVYRMLDMYVSVLERIC